MESLFLLYSTLTMIHWLVRSSKSRTKERTDIVRGEIFKYNYDGQSRTSIQGVKNDTDQEATNLPIYPMSLFNLTLEHE